MTTPTTLRTFLWFPDRLEEALAFYRGTFRDGLVVQSEFRQELHQPLFTADFAIYGHQLTGMAWSGGSAFNDAVSLALRIDGQAEADRIWDALTRDGTPVNCGWCRDPFGVTWQVSPIQMDEYLQHPDAEVREYAWEAMSKMQRIIVADLHR